MAETCNITSNTEVNVRSVIFSLSNHCLITILTLQPVLLFYEKISNHIKMHGIMNLCKETPYAVDAVNKSVPPDDGHITETCSSLYHLYTELMCTLMVINNNSN